MIFDSASLAVVCEGLGYPEGPIAMSDGTLLFVDIKNQCLTRINVDGSTQLVAKVPGGPNGAALGADGYIYLTNNGGFDWTATTFPLPGGQTISFGTLQAADYAGGSLQRVDLRTGILETLYTQCPTSTLMNGLGPRSPEEVPLPSQLRGPDDLVMDDAGGIWFTDLGKVRVRDKDVTGVYYAKADGSSICEKIFPLDAPNGAALSPKGDRLYVSLTYERKVLYWELDGPGSIKPNPATADGSFVFNADMRGWLDSIKVDQSGNVYVMTILPRMTPMCNGGVTVLSPDGAILEYFEIAVPGKFVPAPSNICWGGADRKTAYITCGASDMVVKVRTSIPGLT
jgi:gluconolactonase